MLNLQTKDDYIQAKESNAEGWQKEWLYLLESRFKVNEIGELVEDLDKLIELGFTVEEIEKAINFTGLTNTELTYRKNNPDIWVYDKENDQWTYNENWKQERIEKAIEFEKTILMKELQEARERRLRAGININGLKFSTDEIACQKYNELGMIFMSFPSYEVENWKVKDWETGETKYVTMDIQLWSEVMAKKMHLERRLFDIQKMRIDELKEMSTVQEISSFAPDGSFWENTQDEALSFQEENIQDVQSNYMNLLRYATEKLNKENYERERAEWYQEMERLRLKAEGMDEEMRKKDAELTKREEDLKNYYEEYRRWKEEQDNPTPLEPFEDGEWIDFEQDTITEESKTGEDNNVI